MAMDDVTRQPMNVRVALLEQGLADTKEDVRSMRAEFTEKLDGLMAFIKEQSHQNSITVFVRENWKVILLVALVVRGVPIDKIPAMLGMGG